MPFLTMRAAFESDSQDERPVVVLSGPLSEVYTQALNQVLAKPDPLQVDPEEEGQNGGDGKGEGEPDQPTGEGKPALENEDGSVTPPAGSEGEGTEKEPAEGEAKPEGENKPATESQQQDVTMLQQLSLAISNGKEVGVQDDPEYTIYGVSASDVRPETIVDVAEEMAQMDKPEEFVLVVDATQPGANGAEDSLPQERVVELTEALESLVVRQGGKVYKNLRSCLEDFVDPAQMGSWIVMPEPDQELPPEFQNNPDVSDENPNAVD